MYVPLYVKTTYSLLSSMVSIPKLIAFCKEKGISSIGICDSNLSGVMEFITLRTRSTNGSLGITLC